MRNNFAVLVLEKCLSDGSLECRIRPRADLDHKDRKGRVDPTSASGEAVCRVVWIAVHAIRDENSDTSSTLRSGDRASDEVTAIVPLAKVGQVWCWGCEDKLVIENKEGNVGKPPSHSYFVAE